jgi:hypothetical protein
MPTPPARGADVRFIGPVMGRYTLESRIKLSGVQIFALRLQSISTMQLVASAPVTGQLGEMVTAHFVPFGNIRGRVVRHVDGGFVIDIEGKEDRRKKLAARIEWYKKKLFHGLSDKREHKRFMPREPKSAIVLADGGVLPCLVIDLSSSGAALSADHEPEIGEPLAVGKAVARVVRRLDVGFAVQFVEPIHRDTVEETVRAPDEWDKAMARREAAASAEIASMVDNYEASEANYAI